MRDESYYQALAVCNRLRDAFDERGESLRTVANQMGVYEAQVYRWVSALDFPKIENIMKLAHFFNVSPRYLLDGGKKETFRNYKISYDKITLFKPVEGKRLDKSMCVTRSLLRRGLQKGIFLPTAFSFADYFGVSAGVLFFEERENEKKTISKKRISGGVGR